jgi:Tol biopolymer transport system component
VSSLSNGRNATGSLVALDHVLERCLAKSPDHRWQSARDLHLELEWTAKGTTPGAAPARKRRFQSRRALGWTAGLAASAAAGALAFATLHEPPRQTTRFVIAPAPGTRIGVAENRTRIALSPDGRRLATIASVEGRQQLWLRALDSVVAEPVAGTQGAESPFWSPDSRFVAFFSPGDGQLKKVDVAGGPARTICAAEMESVPVWGADGTILFTQLGDGIYRVSADGGTPTRVTRVDKGRRELNHLWPQFLPDGRHFLYMATAVDANGLRATPSLYAASLDSPDVTMVARMHSRMMLAGPGHVLYVQDGALLAQAFDVVNRRLTGEPMRIADEIAYSRPLGNGGFTVSSNGVLAYQGSADPFSLVWYDRGGGVADAMSAPQSFGSVRLSPDGLRIAADVTDPRTGTADVWIYDAARSAPVRLTTDPGSESQAIWSPDMRRLVFRWGRSGAPSLYERVISTGAETLLASESIPLTPEDWSPDGRWIAYVKQTRRTAYDLWLLPLSGDRKPVPFATTGFDDWGARFSPDSRWVAFASAESGSPEVYVAPIGEPANKTRVSTGGGSTPRWRSDGRELFYASADYRSIMVAATQTGGTFIVGAPARALSLGATPVARDRARNMVYDVSPDGRRFLVSLPAGEPTSSRVTVVLNWTNALNH